MLPSTLPPSDDKRATDSRMSSSAKRVDAFRDRLQDAGLLRKEVLVSAETNARLAVLAKLHRTSAVNVASALLEAGLAHYEATGHAGTAAGTGVQGALSRSSLGTASACVGSTATALSAALPPAGLDPITDFFNRRKEPYRG